MISCTVFDIDGTLADIRHRLHFVTCGKPDWPGFFAAMGADTPNPGIVELAMAAGSIGPVVIVTGRPEDHRAVTEAWITAAGLTPAALYMRRSGDHRADALVKREILDAMRSDGYDPRLVVDDRPEVVAMWRAEGITCLQMAYDECPGPASGLLTLLVGPSGGGKSTFAASNFPARLVISSDDVREDMLGDRHDQTANERVFAAVHALARERVRRGLPAVIDATNLRRKDRMACAGLSNGGPVRYIVINRPMADKIQTRDWRPEWLIQRHEQTFRSQLRDILGGDGLPNVTVEDRRS